MSPPARISDDVARLMQDTATYAFDRRFGRHYPDASVMFEREDMIAAAVLRMVRRHEAYDATRGALTTWFHRQAEGAFVDYIRSRAAHRGEGPRSENKGVRGGPPGAGKGQRFKLLSFEAPRPDFPCGKRGVVPTIGDSLIGDYDVEFSDQAFSEKLHAALDQVLSSREKLVITLYSDEGTTLAEIGVLLGVTESRACQILKAAREKLLKHPTIQAAAA